MKTNTIRTKIILTYTMLALMSALYSLNANAANPIYKSHPVGTKPERVTQAFDEKLFVSVMGEKTAGDGTIIKIMMSH